MTQAMPLKIMVNKFISILILIIHTHVLPDFKTKILDQNRVPCYIHIIIILQKGNEETLVHRFTLVSVSKRCSHKIETTPNQVNSHQLEVNHKNNSNCTLYKTQNNYIRLNTSQLLRMSPSYFFNHLMIMRTNLHWTHGSL